MTTHFQQVTLFKQPKAQKIGCFSHQTAKLPSHKMSCSYPLFIHTHTHQPTRQIHRKHNILNHETTSVRIKKNTTTTNSQTWSHTRRCTQPSVFHTQTASRGTNGSAEARLEGMKQIKRNKNTMQWLEREWSDKVGATWRRWIFATVIPTQRETKADTRVLLVKPFG